MILIVDALNKHQYTDILDQMFRLRARVFGARLGWKVEIKDGRERDRFDDLDPVYFIGLDEEDRVISCVRGLQTTGPHMLADVFCDILDGEPPLRSPNVWEATRFCVDTERLAQKGEINGASKATCEMMIASIEYLRDAGITDAIAVIDPVFDRVMRRVGNGAYDYLGKTVQMGKVRAMAGLLDCTDERIARLREFAGIDYDVVVDEAALLERLAAKVAKPAELTDALAQYFIEQLDAAQDTDELEATLALADTVLGKAKPAQPAPVSDSVSLSGY